MDNSLDNLLPVKQTSSHGQYESLKPINRHDHEETMFNRSTEGSSPVDSSFESDLESQPVTLNVIGLTYKIKERPGQWWNCSCFRSSRVKTVLNNLCVTFAKGELTALVGSSGSGKTSLLDVISGRADGQISGIVSYKLDQCTRPMMRQMSSYVLQADRLLPTLTVKETLTYMAYLKLPGHLNSSEISFKVQSVINDMGLNHVADSRIGGAVVRGVSGGEKRRITIAVQLLKDPEILLLDEPTSGLDAFTARQLVSSLAHIAHKGKLVIMSIHQPRSDIFNLLDKLAILTVGQIAYFGRPDQLVPYFTSIGYACPKDENPCDVYIDITSVDRRSAVREKSTVSKVQKLCKHFANSDLQAAMVKHITVGLGFYTEESIAPTLDRSKHAGPSWPRTFYCLLRRMNVHLWRDRSAFLGRFLLLPFFVPFILIFIGRLEKDQESIQNRLGLMYQSTQVTAYVGLTNGIALFPVMRELFYRECHDGLYSTFTFLLTYFVHCLPFNVITATIFCSALYWIAGLRDGAWPFGAFILVCVVLVQFGELLTISILGLLRNVQLANNTTTLLFSASGLISSGLLRAVSNMPKPIQWIGYVAIHKYAAEIVVANEFHDLHFTSCNRSQPVSSCMETGDEFLNVFYSGAYENMGRDFGLLAGYSVAILVLANITFKARGIPTLH